MITTIKGPVKDIGSTYIHEHIALDLSRVKRDEDTNFNQLEEIIKEFKLLKEKGLDTVVEVSNRGMGRDIAAMLRVAEESDLNIIASTGFYKEPFLPQYFYDLSDRELEELLLEDINVGIDGSGARAHVLGEVGTSHEIIRPTEKRCLKIIARVHLQTGKPIFTHSSLGTMALEQIDIFKRKGVDLEKVLIGHMDLNNSIDYHLRVADSGCFLGFDTIGKLNYQADENRIFLIKELIKRGHEDQIVLSLDLTRNSHLKKFGGIGYSYLLDEFLPNLKSLGVGEKLIDKFLRENPKRLLGQ